MKAKKTYLTICILLIVALAVFLVYKYKHLLFGNKNEEITTIEEVIPKAVFPLKKGSSGSYVKKIQEWINKQADIVFVGPLFAVPGIPLVTDGIWGSKTDAALKYISENSVTINVPRSEIDETFYKLYIKPNRLL